MAGQADVSAAQEKFIEAVDALTATGQIKWYKNEFGDRCAEVAISMIGVDGDGKTTLRFSSAPPRSGSGCSFQCSDESVKALGAKIKGETLAYLAKPGRKGQEV